MIQKVFYSIFTLYLILIHTGISACSLPPDIIHEFRLEVVPGADLEIHYTLSAWGNLESKIQREIQKLGGVESYLRESLIASTHLQIDGSPPINLVYMTGRTISYTGMDAGIFGISQMPLIEGVYRTNIPSDALSDGTAELRFEKTHFREITPLIHPYLFSNIQQSGTEGSYAIGDDGEQYFTYTHLGQHYSIRNILKEGELENHFTLIIRPPITRETTVAAPSAPAGNATSLWGRLTEVSQTLERFFYERGNTPLRILGLVLAVILGMAHGLLPGHSKTLISTFIMSKRQTTRGQILLLIASSAFSHTFFLFILATLVLFLGKGLSHMAGYIITASAVGYIAFGIYFVQRGRAMLTHIRTHIPLLGGAMRRSLVCTCDTETRGSEKSIFTSGVLAGMNPCIDALALFLLALSIGDGLYALGMVLAFSLGLGLMLGILASLVSQGKSWMRGKSETWSETFSAYTTLISGILIILLGTYTLFS